MKNCAYFKPQRADSKRHGCVQSEPCDQCEACAYVAPGEAIAPPAKVEKVRKKKK